MSENIEEKFEVRDLRDKDKFFIDDKFFNGYVKILGTTALAVYCALCRYSNKEQKCWPSQQTIANDLGLSFPIVNKYIGLLEQCNIIRKKRIGKSCTNRYWLLKKINWLKPEVILSTFISPDIKQNEITLLTRMKSPIKQNEIHSKDNTSKDNTYKVLEETSSSEKNSSSFKKDDYEFVLKEYQRLKQITLKGEEFNRARRSIKSMFSSERSVQDIISCMEWFAEKSDSNERNFEWTKNWVIETIARKIPEFLSGRLEPEEDVKIPEYAKQYSRN